MAVIDTVDENDQRLKRGYILLPKVVICLQAFEGCATITFGELGNLVSDKLLP